MQYAAPTRRGGHQQNGWLLLASFKDIARKCYVGLTNYPMATHGRAGFFAVPGPQNVGSKSWGPPAAVPTSVNNKKALDPTLSAFSARAPILTGHNPESTFNPSIEVHTPIHAMSCPQNLGFIGLGVMGFPMAQNLARKVPSTTKIHVFDISKEVTEKLASEFPNTVFVSSSAKDVASKSVRASSCGNMNH